MRFKCSCKWEVDSDTAICMESKQTSYLIFGQAYRGKSHREESGNCREMAQVHRSFILKSHFTSHHCSSGVLVQPSVLRETVKDFKVNLYTICTDNKTCYSPRATVMDW